MSGSQNIIFTNPCDIRSAYQMDANMHLLLWLYDNMVHLLLFCFKVSFLMIFVNDNGRCAHMEAVRGTGVLAALTAYAKFIVLRMYPDLERIRGGTYNTKIFLETHKRKENITLHNFNNSYVTFNIHSTV